jgi:hypothetical protein
MSVGVESPVASQIDDVGSHAPLTQTVFVPQVWPQLPQFCASVARTVHVLPHADHPGSQTAPHVAPEHIRTEFVIAGHACPQLPQFAPSICGFTHWPLHAIWPAGQIGVPHVPSLVHVGNESGLGAVHAFPQLPQW